MTEPSARCPYERSRRFGKCIDQRPGPSTSVYTHVATDDDGKVGDMFDFAALVTAV